jgi:hypothetical protein
VALTTLKMAALAPTPIAIVAIAMETKPGDRTKVRPA